MVALDHTNITLPRMGNKFAGRVRERHRVLLQFRTQFRTQFRYLENAATQTLLNHQKLICKNHVQKNTPKISPSRPELRREAPCIVQVVVDEQYEILYGILMGII